jgi:hypothetical protein
MSCSQILLPVEANEKQKFYGVRMPIHSDLKRWVQKWWGRESFTADKHTTIGTLLLSNIDLGEPPFEAEYKTIDAMDDYLPIQIPIGWYLTQRRIVIINEVIRHWLIDQLVAVSLAKRHNLESPATAVIQYYAIEFDLQKYTQDALEKASQRLREQRGLPRFITRRA